MDGGGGEERGERRERRLGVSERDGRCGSSKVRGHRGARLGST